MKTMAEIRKEAKSEPKFVLFTDEFGYDMFIAAEFKKEVIVEKQDTAMIFSVGFDNEEIKVKTYSALTGYNLKFKII